jgi:DNA-directed RNA polymerase specialized sigma24 family protein
VFPLTHQSVIERVRSADADVRRAAFGDVAAGYWRPTYHYLRLQWRLDPADAEDAVQAFFTTAFEKQYLEKFDPAKARFRTFLRLCVDRFVQNRRQAERAAKRGGGATTLSVDFATAERELALLPATVSDAERFFHDETVRALFARALQRLRREFEAAGRGVIVDVFERHDVAPGAATTYASVGAALGLSTSQVTNHLHTARAAFRDAALAELRAISASDREFEDDARALFGARVDAPARTGDRS